MELTPYAERLAVAMGAPEGEKPSADQMHALADKLIVSYQAIAKVFAGTTESLSARNNTLAARHLRVDSDWLATGDGEMRSERVWPFGGDVTPEEFFALDAASVQAAVDVLQSAVKRMQGAAPPVKQHTDLADRILAARAGTAKKAANADAKR